jgi:CheY-like chemotaxis protein
MIVQNVEMVTILLVEDDPGHARLVELNLRRAGIYNTIKVVSDGQQAIDYLFGQGEYAAANPEPPMLVLLDLNMPVMDGYQVLEKIKSDNRTKAVPVVVLTTTEDAREVARCYELGCNIYITKPVEYDQFSEAIRKLGLFLGVVKVPNGE